MISSTNKNHEDILFCLTLVVSVVFDFTLGGGFPRLGFYKEKTFVKPQKETIVWNDWDLFFAKEEVVFKKQTNINLVTWWWWRIQSFEIRLNRQTFDKD